MKLILSRKINSALTVFLLYISFCFAEFYFARGAIAYSMASAGSIYSSKIFSNIIFAFFIGGALPFAFYEIVTGFIFKGLRRKLGAVTDDMRYALRFYYFASNVVIGLISLLYFISPLISVYGEIFVPFVCTGVFFALYLKYVCSHCVEKSLTAFVLMQCGSVYLIFYGISTILKIFGVM